MGLSRPAHSEAVGAAKTWSSFAEFAADDSVRCRCCAGAGDGSAQFAGVGEGSAGGNHKN